MGIPIERGRLADPDALVGMEITARSAISHDGREVLLEITRNGRQFCVLPLNIGSGGILYHELRVGLQTAERRQRMTKRLAKEAIADILSAALRPEAIGFDIDPESGDVFAVFLFSEHAPFAVQISAEMLQKAIADVQKLVKRRAN